MKVRITVTVLEEGEPDSDISGQKFEPVNEVSPEQCLLPD